MAEQENSNAILTSCDVTTRRKEGRKGRKGGGESKEGRKEGKRKEWKEREMED